jgi:hypothetical protein
MKMRSFAYKAQREAFWGYKALRALESEALGERYMHKALWALLV